MQKFNRRQMIQLMGTGLASVYLAGCASVNTKKKIMGSLNDDWMTQFGPVNRLVPDRPQVGFSGDSPSNAHRILWGKDAYLSSIGGRPAPTETVDIAIVGGGMSGLLSAYFLQDLRPVLLEQSDRLGGSSRAESWRGVDYSIATAYFAIPDAGSKIEKFLKDINFTNYRIRETEDPIFIDGKRHDNIWEHGTSEASRPQFQKLRKYFDDIWNEANGQQYPSIPFSEAKRAHVEKLDKIDFLTHIRQVLGEPVHQDVQKCLDHYFWSACASSATEVSAAGGLNFYTAEFAPLGVPPGGNAALAEKILSELVKTGSTENFRTGTLVFDVREEKDGVVVTYVKDGKVQALKAKSVIMSCPKFVVGKLIDNLEPKRREVYSELRYRSYMMANVLVDQPARDDYYDYFFFDSKPETAKEVEKNARRQRVTDFVNNGFANGKKPQTVYSLFRGFPYDGARHEILAEDAFARYSEEFKQQLHNEIMPMMGIEKDKIVDIRIARHGHPLPLNKAGLISSRKVDWLRKPFGKRVFFVEQDNWMLPAFETCFAEADKWTPEVRKVVRLSTPAKA